MCIHHATAWWVQEAVWTSFIARVRVNLHLVLTMSPVGDAFRARCVGRQNTARPDAWAAASLPPEPLWHPSPSVKPFALPYLTPPHLPSCPLTNPPAFHARRCRQFPSLINCTTIDWFAPWPTEALLSVSSQFLASTDLGSEEVKAAVAAMCVIVHTSVEVRGG